MSSTRALHPATVAARRRALPLLLLLPAIAFAQPAGGPYVMRRQVVAAGAVATGGNYRLTGTAQQPVAAASSFGAYRLTGGFHGPGQKLFCDGLEDAPCR
jgi:hypothetical protein